MSESYEKSTSEKNVDGIAVIKEEYIIKDVEVLTSAINAEYERDTPADSERLEESNEQPFKKAKFNGKKKKEKGQNKARGPTYRQNRETQLCPHILEGNSKCPLEKCIFMHDKKEFIDGKLPDIDSVCPVFTNRGFCPRGITCRYGSQHIDADGNNIVDEITSEKWNVNKKVQTLNTLSKDIQHDLRKRKYDFAKSEDSLSRLDKRKLKTREETCSNGEANVSEGNSELMECKDAAEKLIGPADSGPSYSIRDKKKIDWRDKLYLSPLTTVGNLPFRRICKDFGVDITCGEMALASNILQGAYQEWALIKRHGTEDLFGVQVCGNNPYVLTRCAQVLQEQADIDFIDVNLGCPIDLVYQQGGGCGLMRREKVLYSVVECMNDVLNIPLTVKMRTGVYSDKNIAHNLIGGLCNRGVSLITVHGRSREQRYTRRANWDYIEKCAASAGETPVFGNGDILSYEDYVEARKSSPSISGVMIGRGALIKPWIFTEIKEQRMWDISSNERLDILRNYVNYGLHHWGSDTKGVENTRRFLLEWLSFLYRYIPVGLLEYPPQKVNQRPPFYRGRNELETLMASPNCNDWLKISEMLLGPVPDGFTFLPKHKANSWK